PSGKGKKNGSDLSEHCRTHREYSAAGASGDGKEISTESTSGGKIGVSESLRKCQGPGGAGDVERRAGKRADRAGSNDRGANLRKYGDRAGGAGSFGRVSSDPDDAGDHERGA